MAESRVADIGTLQLAVAGGRLQVLYPFWKDPFAFTQFKDENLKWLIQKCVISEHCSWQLQMAHTSSAIAFG